MISVFLNVGEELSQAYDVQSATFHDIKNIAKTLYSIGVVAIPTNLGKNRLPSTKYHSVAKLSSNVSLLYSHNCNYVT